MLTVVPNILLDDIVIHKSIAANKMSKIFDMIDKETSGKMIRTASNGNDRLINLFCSMLSALNMSTKEGDVKELVNKLAVDSSELNKTSSINKNSVERRDDIKIVSKSVKDSHYQVDLSKDIIQKDGRKMIMVSCYARDSYLGRYLIKRNYFYTEDRNKFADSSYDEILTKIGSIKDRYYNDIIDISEIFSQLKQTLDGVISEIQMKEDSVGTTSHR